MWTFNRFLSVLTLLALMSGPAAISAAAQSATPDDQQYDQPGDQPSQPDMGQPNIAQPDTAQPETTLPEAQPVPQYDDQQPAQAEPAQPQYDQPGEEQPAPDAQASASSPSDQPLPTDPPGRAARLQYMTGSVSVQPQGTGDWVAGELNRPLTNSDNIWADKDSRAEISVGTGEIRIGAESSLTLTNINENTVQLQLHQGALYLHVRRLYDNEKYEVDTPNQAFTVEKPGDYRFDVNPDADKTVVTVWSGQGESTGDGQPVEIHANEQVKFTNGTSLTMERHAAPAPDGFDQWAQARDNKFDHSESARYVAPDTVGGDDLDEYGVWKETPDYGAVWYPSVAPGWAPYNYGHWIYQSPWGWTWVDYEPWGFAPFHYGRWIYGGGGWGWAPGPIYDRPWYSPAMVAWFGGGVGIGFGWCPLGWGEPFIPWYGVSRGYFYHVNFTNGRFWGNGRYGNLNRFYGSHFVNGRFAARDGFSLHYANMRRPGGFTAISRNTLVNSLSVAHNNLRMAPNQMSRMTAVHSLGVTPTRASIMGSRGTRAAVPPSRAFSRPVVSRAATANRGSFNSAGRGFNSNIARPGQMSRMQRPAMGNANRGPAFNNSRPGLTNSRPMAGALGPRSVPRPPNAGNFGSRSMGATNGMGGGRYSSPQMNSRNGGINGRYSSPQMGPRNNVPRPPSASMGRSGPSYSPRGISPSYSPRGGSPSYSPRGGAAPGAPRSNGPRGAMNVPRPSSSYIASSRNSQSYGRSSQNYGGSYGRSASPYSGGRSMGSYGGSYSRPSNSYGGGGYGRPSYGGSAYARSSGSYGGGRSAYSGGFGGARPSGSFGGGRSYGGGGHASSGGFGGGHFGGGGGGHVGGGGGGGHFGGGGGHSGGGGHGGRR